MKGCAPFTVAEMRRIDAAFAGRTATRDRALFRLGCCTGFRISEMLALARADVAPGGPGAAVVAEVYVPRRNRKGRVSGLRNPLNADATHALALLVAELDDAGYTRPADPLFQADEIRSRPVGYRRALAILKTTCARVGVVRPPRALGWHSCRKTAGGHVYDATSDYHLAAQLLGHQSGASTAAYLPRDAGRIRDLVTGWNPFTVAPALDHPVP